MTDQDRPAPGPPTSEHQPSGRVSTSDAMVDRAVERLDELDERDLESHPGVFDDIHATLRQALDGSDGAPASGS